MVTEDSYIPSRPALISRRMVLSLAVLVPWVVLVMATCALSSELSVTPDEQTPAHGAFDPLPSSPEAGGTEGNSPQQEPPPETTGENGESDLEGKRAALMEKLGGAVAQERGLLHQSLAFLDREEAAQWLRGFISSPPLNCPLNERDQWIEAVILAVERNRIPICKEILGLVACVVAIESGFNADPLAVDPASGETMADVLERAERELYEKAGMLLSVPPLPGLYAAYRGRYYPQLLACRTEGEVENLAKIIAGELKRDGQRLPDALREPVFQGIDKLANVVRTKGSMQLNFNRAWRVMEDRGHRFTAQELSDYMYTVPGGVDVGVAALRPMFVQYAARYATPDNLSWLFFVGMDYHYGAFSSRNMMEQIRIRDLSGRDLALDGDFLHYDKLGRPLERQSRTLEATQAILPSIPVEQILEAFLLEKDPHYNYTDVHKHIGEAHRQRFGETPFAVIGDLWMGKEAKIKHGTQWRTRAYLKKLDKYLNSLPWDSKPKP
ncbi:DUF1615 family protein [Thermodesulfobacteriota bacterium]